MNQIDPFYNTMLRDFLLDQNLLISHFGQLLLSSHRLAEFHNSNPHPTPETHFFLTFLPKKIVPSNGV